MLDLEGAVRSAAQKGALLWTLPWVNSYLWFLQPPAHTPAPLSPRLLAQLSQLRWAAFNMRIAASLTRVLRAMLDLHANFH